MGALVMGIVGLGVALLAGCGGSQKNKNVSAKKIISEEKPAQKEEGYPLDFKEGSQTSKLYETLKKDGVKDSELDQGYYVKDCKTQARKKVHAQDQVVQKEEVLNYALENSQRYQLAIEEIMDYEVPWTLDDLDPETDFDQELRGKAGKAVVLIKQELKKVGLKEDEEKYQELLAASLFAYSLASDAYTIDKMQVKIELENAKLDKVIDYISAGNSLGLVKQEEIEFIVAENGDKYTKRSSKDCELELSALEALQAECGACLEQSLILYGVFKLAGLEPVFVHAQHKTGFYHSSVALELPKKTRIYDPSQMDADAEVHYKNNFNWWHTEDARETLAGFYNNLAAQHMEIEENEKSMDARSKSAEINTHIPETHNNLAISHFKKNDHEKAVSEFEKALKLCPTYYEAQYNLGNILRKYGIKLFNNGDIKQGWEKFKEAEKQLEAIPSLADPKVLESSRDLLEDLKSNIKMIEENYPELISK